MKEELIKKAYEIAVERYAAVGVDANKALEDLQKISLSLHCWQADDVTGFESSGSLTGGIQATGNYPGKARRIETGYIESCFLYSRNSPFEPT